MKDIVDWLASVESRAAILYAQAAVVFASDKEFALFLKHLAEEEEEHIELLSRAADGIVWEGMAEACFELDETTRQSVENPFSRGHAMLKSGNLTKAAMLGVIAESEFSEWNEMFLYVVDTLKGQGRELQKAVAEIDHHRLDIETFISSFSWGDRILQKIGRLRPVWKQRILVVEDDPAIANLIKSLAETEAEVVLAEDGAKGLEKIREGHFDVVISDVEMPNLNGIELYQQALEMDPELGKRFVFFSATSNPEYCRFIESTEAVLLSKPAPLSLLRKVINEVAAAN